MKMFIKVSEIGGKEIYGVEGDIEKKESMFEDGKYDDKVREIFDIILIEAVDERINGMNAAKNGKFGGYDI